MNYLGEPKKLAEWLSDSAAYPADGWLYIKTDVASLDLTTLCWPGIVESIELSNEEYDEMESWLEKNGFKSFLNNDEIEDVANNLVQQLSSYTDAQLLKAVRHYWENDAFIEAESI
ncbi:DUF7716 domain-containing protein [Azotobacter beijerinckii]|uniref:DUF7716 domain-containing protein n=1 Tax=Azotobacter beijerinckii TaxID=170623 RepID=UPI0029557083|nr:hypothetical protein [Azotobacter beijerinckii]MDV7214025.1 hypothetical protein [Azotobacter beijerinckii]